MLEEKELGIFFIVYSLVSEKWQVKMRYLHLKAYVLYMLFFHLQTCVIYVNDI